MSRRNLREEIPSPSACFRKLLRLEAGAPDVFGSERSFHPPIGELWQGDRSASGYFIDFRIKTDNPTWPPAWLPPLKRQLHVATVQWALGAWERYAAGEGPEWREGALGAAEHLLSIQIRKGACVGGFAHLFEMPHTYRLDPPWLSAITQGEAASLFARLSVETGDDRFAAAARTALLPMSTSSANGGLLATLDGRPFVEEYPSDPSSYVLNGAMFGVWGFFDVGRLLGDDAASDRFDELATALAETIHRFDTGWWSLYDAFPHPLPNIASAAYHGLHIKQLAIMAEITGDDRFAAMGTRFEAYRASRRSRIRSFAEKVAFRFIVPRNPAVARTLPWSPLSNFNRRPRTRQGNLLVLCYHGVSRDWGGALAVTPESFEEQIRHLADQGYRSATFTEAVCGQVKGKVVAITFDDAYRSVAELAWPILERHGFTATVFAPTDFVGSTEPMSWPGIERWLGGPNRDELLPMSWAELRELRDAGWEIGSHTCSHPALTRIDAEALADQMERSRRDCESNLGGPCTSIAYPYGDVDERVRQAAEAAGFSAGAALTNHSAEVSVFAWPRMGIYNVDGPKAFRVKVSPRGRRLRRSRAWKPVALALHPFRRHEQEIN